MDGFAATAQLKSDPITAEIPVIALTALAMSRDQGRGRQPDCDAFITKSLRYQELQDAMRWLLLRADDEASAVESGVLTPSAPERATSYRGTVGSTPSSSAEGRTPRAPGSTRIRVAGDNPRIQKLILWQLNLMGYEPDTANDG